jgi:large subunit ribosomal protein L21
MYAVIEACGRQYRVEEGTLLQHERVEGAELGGRIEFDRVLLLVDDGNIRVGAPYLDGAKVVGEVREEGLGDKVLVYKYKSKKGYRRLRGHRQRYMTTRITAIEA